MPSPSEHDEQYRKNKSFLDTLDIDKTPYLDWVATIAFYSALHLVQIMLSQKGINPADHRERMAYVSRLKELKQVSAKYHVLYMESCKARYNCKKYTLETIRPVLACLVDIESQLGVPRFQ